MTLDEAAALIGAGVTYDLGYGISEDGAIVSVNEQWVHVRYAGSPDAKATPAERLTLTPPRPVPEHYAEVITRYGGWKHLAFTDPSALVGSRHYTRCRSTSAWTVESWEADPDHPFLSIDAIRHLPRCPDCMAGLSA